MRATLGRLFAVGLIVVAVTGCDVVGTTSYDYSNPLDPREDTAISALLPYVVDANLRQAITDNVGGDTSTLKSQYTWLDAYGYTVAQLDGIEYFSAITDFNMGSATLGAPGSLDALTRLGNLHWLNMNDCGLDDSHLATVARIPSLNGAWLTYNAFTIDGLRALVGSPLEELTISGPDTGNGLPGYTVTVGTSVIDEFVIAGLANQIRAVGLENFNLTGPDLADLARLPNLRWGIRLGNNQIASLATLNAQVLARYDADTELWLELWGNPLSEAELATLDLSKLGGLNLGNMGDGSTLTAVPAFSGPAPHLRELWLDGNSSLSDITNLTTLLGFAPIERLSLGSIAVSDVSSIGATGSTSLREIYLNDINGGLLSGVETLVGLPNLSNLILSNATLANEATVRATYDARPDIFVEYPDNTTNQP
tara:strand:- start:711 stop:1982 length:1272 start_codon:yes stop_codon:yes gene_type:complete